MSAKQNIKRLFASLIIFIFSQGVHGQMVSDPQNISTAIIHTNMGDITILLNHELAPKTTHNFIKYAESGFYDSTIFHRVIKDFMIQGGGLTEDMNDKTTGKAIEHEGNRNQRNSVGTIAMARTNDPHSATSQFFINLKDNDFLNYRNENEWGYCVFGEVVSGMDVVAKIGLVNTVSRKGHQDVPDKPVIIEKVELISAT